MIQNRLQPVRMLPTTRMPNTYKIATDNKHNYECPTQVKKSNQYFNFPKLEVIHRSDLTFEFAAAHQNYYFTVIDGKKVVGYYECGKYTSLKDFY
jgi:hypothetical protein